MAIVSAACRLPGADSLPSYWDGLLRPHDSILRDPDAEPDGSQQLLASERSRFVRAYGSVGDTARFDHQRFGMSPAEAMLTDPQQRILLELVDEALHASGVSSAERAGAGVFVGTSVNRYDALLSRSMRTAPGVDDFAIELGTARDYAAGKIAYRLDLGGPALNVLAACATGLIAVHLACRSLLSSECDVAVVAVSAIQFPEWRGYWAATGGIGSPDGVCRPFDARANGSVPADGAAALVLKRVDAARAIGDRILAVVRGSAANNDGRKAGFAEVSGTSQDRLIGAALRAAEAEPSAVRYVESHGSATRLGDAVEWSTLQRLFGRNDAPTYVGAVKGNIGHAREASGLAALLKAVLALNHGTIPASAHFEQLPEDLAVPDSPVMPVSMPTRFDTTTGKSVIGVSAFGLGGTNCHVVLEAAPRPQPSSADRHGLILLSSHREDTLDVDTLALHHIVERQPHAVGPLAARSQTRHHSHVFRRYLHTPNKPDERAGAASTTRTMRAPKRPEPVVFAFPGIGSGYAGMCASLAAKYEVFRQSRDETIELAADVGVDIRAVLAATHELPHGEAIDLRRLLGRGPAQRADALQHADIAVSHLSLFAVQVALCDLLASANLRPAAVVGHSLGEWTAATMAGCLSRANAVGAIALRARLIGTAPRGATFAVSAGADEVRPLLVAGAVISAHNSAGSCLVSALDQSVAPLLDALTNAHLIFRRLPGHAPFHHPALRDAASALEAAIGNMHMATPAIRMVSTLSGTWIKDGQMTGRHWAQHMMEPVLCQQALTTVASRFKMALEIGPGNMRPWMQQTGRLEVARTAPQSYERANAVDICQLAWAELWLRGHQPSWPVAADARSGVVSDPPPALHRLTFDPRMAADRSADDASAGRAEQVHRPDPASPEGTNAWIGAPPQSLDDWTAALAAQWCALLGTPTVGGDDDFFQLGGDSLLGRHLTARLERLCGSDVPVHVVFASGTLRGMATAIHDWLSSTGASRA